MQAAVHALTATNRSRVAKTHSTVFVLVAALVWITYTMPYFSEFLFDGSVPTWQR